jgi:hypothetical protein
MITDKQMKFDEFGMVIKRDFDRGLSEDLNSEKTVHQTKIERFIEQKNKKKSIERRNYSLRLMQDYPGEYNCKECIHGITGSCTDNLPSGCQLFYDTRTGRSFSGIDIRKERIIQAIRDYHRNKKEKRKKGPKREAYVKAKSKTTFMFK